jgi:TATA-binding protein-associated factor
MHEIKIRGVSMVLNLIVSHCSDELPKKLPQLWNTINSSVKTQIDSYSSALNGNLTGQNAIRLVKDLTVLQVVGQNLGETLQSNLFDLFADLIRILSSPDPLIRHQVCRCIGMISKLKFETIETSVLTGIVPMLESNQVTSRCGAIEAIALIIEHFNLELVPKIDMYIVHVLRRMSDQNDQIRMMATHCFGKLLSLMPLNYGRDRHAKRMIDGKTSMKTEESEFIEQLLDPRKLKNYQLPFDTSVQLRSYQQEGLNWLAFLNRFNLHGILCDEMGLGKTFMTICIVASDHFHLSKLDDTERSPSLIVCPPTLVEHWLYEIEKFVPSETRTNLNPIAYGGNSSDRTSIKNRLSIPHISQGSKRGYINLIVTSYDVLRNDIDFFKTIEWNYCVLDEGHIIKNGKTKLSKAVRLLTARHRLILSGTPIQNNVTELWSLFDFLMPGFLGSERHFNSRYAKPILQSREHKCSPRDLEAGALAMESLHRQVLPFILRRLKDDVLDDLPPKIMQDYYCELSPLQSKLYEDFTQGKLCNEVTKKSIDQLSSNSADVDLKNLSRSHVFQALQYLKSVCNHPKLVLTPKHSQYNQIKKYLESEKNTLDDINHSSKLRALKQLLIDCGIGCSEEAQQTSLPQQNATALELESVVNQHRALIFCQLRSMIEIIENDLFKKHLPGITYLKLDGSVPTNQRQSIVSRFNNDPSIDVLLLTTQIGGLGLNLIGADTVIFVEHDWNPTRDLQAMDRAHRIGQKKVVNIYRLITKDTLEEKIMGLQKFKTMVSSTVINLDNTGLGSMNVDQLLDLFEVNANDNSKVIRRETSGLQTAVDLLPEMWDQQQYETEYDLDTFVSSLKN